MNISKGIAMAITGILAMASAQSARADGWVTMHGASCKPTTQNSSISYGNELWNGGSATVTIICPLTNHWGGDTDNPVGISPAPVEMHFGSNAAASSIKCKLTREDLFGNILYPKNDPIPASGSGWYKRVDFAPLTLNADPSVHNYYVTCSFPPLSALYNVRYQSKAVPKP
jgi:hypothetical protein